MATVAAPQPSLAAAARNLGAKAVARVYAAAKAGAASVIGTAGMVAIAVGAGMVYLPAGFIVGGVLAVWLASLLPAGER
jgi:hypothetical protein